MNSEKVKEIKKITNLCIARGAHCSCCAKEKETDSMLTCRSLMEELLDLITELESENERLLEQKWDKEDDLDNYHEENKQLKDRIAELENGIAKSMLGCEFLPKCTNDKLKQFAEMLKEQMSEGEFLGHKYKLAVFRDTDIDETLKEFLND